MKENYAPLYEALMNNINKKPISFHVPGHKYGRVFPKEFSPGFETILKFDATEVRGLDDLHAPEEAIKEALQLASDFFQSKETFFLVNGTTVGNLAMILSVCQPGDEIIVQRNCHKSVLNGLELAGASPVFIAPRYERETGRYSSILAKDVEEALSRHPNSKAVFLTYPDYFGSTYDLESIADIVHHSNLPLLVDEAHGVHFHLGETFPKSALASGADVVVQSAHKMSPAMTMASFLHIGGDRIDAEGIRHYLQILQSSSPSYPLMASLDLARFYMASWGNRERKELRQFTKNVRSILDSYDHLFTVKPSHLNVDPLKLTLEAEACSGYELAEALDAVGIVPEMATSEQVLLVLGLGPSLDLTDLNQRLGSLEWQLKNSSNHATIKENHLPLPVVQNLEYSYFDMRKMMVEKVDWSDAAGYVAAEAIIPYPPGIPMIMKGERISESHYQKVTALIKQGARFQNKEIEQGIRVFKGE
ncbi:lysine decarboxylase [Halobacillus dabanensis]|uniref:Lysine decarboxylase n=1 Tax=Halobacillus dabanensis TaxID=240302 RepID=A0A1I4AQK0_HALDA|nr:aminotransferase class I/II-fold pyridoxal phosphate-dependent enzyme [Halobacillus dabanensis]SFK58217.1 lysine decarboxylase [Halobacillus dabanensis]